MSVQKVVIHKIYSFSNPKEDILHVDYDIMCGKETEKKRDALMQELKTDIRENGGEYWIKATNKKFENMGVGLP